MKIKNHFLSRLLLTVCILSVVATSCRKDKGGIDPSIFNNTNGFYILNQGNMGSNKA
ncbi:MAG: YncE family protein, partial [Bacteroidetes bacterium]|nr:YncE family protein [Bacteroidota bacterium]